MGSVWVLLGEPETARGTAPALDCTNKPRTQVGGPRTWVTSSQPLSFLLSPCEASLSLEVRPAAAPRELSVTGGARQELESRERKATGSLVVCVDSDTAVAV